MNLQLNKLITIYLLPVYLSNVQLFIYIFKLYHLQHLDLKTFYNTYMRQSAETLIVIYENRQARKNDI